MRIPSFKEVRGFLAECSRQLLEPPLYSVAISAYELGVRLAAIKNPKASKLSAGQREIWKKLDRTIHTGDRYIWVHAASLGEFEQGRPLIEKLRAEKPEYKILLTFFSPSGYEVRKNYAAADCVCYLPFDTPRRVRRFLYKVNPEIAIFVKYEIWRNYLHQLWNRQIPVYLISAVFRPEQSFFKRRSSWYGAWLRWYTGIFVQDENSRKLLNGIGIENVEVYGDTRFDRVANIRETRRPIPEIECFLADKPDAPVMVIGSSWPTDEAVYASWFRNHPEIKLIVAPHEFDAARLEAMKSLFGPGTVLFSEIVADSGKAVGARTLIIDTFGMLSSIYGYASAAYVGGGFGAGLHNINEAAVYGIPVIYGPNNKKFIEARELAECGGGLPVGNKEEFGKAADSIFGDVAERKRRGEAAGKYIESKIGATDRIFHKIFD